ncbi:MAG: ATP-binding protein [Gammaproteobacteria bacterium]|nr:ATP-binding protein [Gammaproteobacteria bacterium]
MSNSIKEYIASDNPLSDEASEFLMKYQEEDTLVDFKLSFDNEEREWLEITKDILAYSNTFGGYLIFGVKDGTFDKVGLVDDALIIVRDANNIIQKVNRFIEPHIQLIRCKQIQEDNKDFVVVFIPPALDKTHIIIKDASFTFPSGKDKTVLKNGTTYVRRSAGNHLMDARDLDDIINRRISYFNNSLLDKIARVVEAPQNSEVFIVSEDQTNGEHNKFIVEAAPDAIPVKGMSFTVSPETIDQEIMGWIAMNEREHEALPTAAITWKWYKERSSTNLSTEQKLNTAKFSLLTGVPAFYWLQGCDAASIKKMLLDALTLHPNISSIGDIVSTAAFLGNKFHKSLIGKLGEYTNRIAPAKRNIPGSGPKVLFRADKIQPKGSFLKRAPKQENLEDELNNIAKSAEQNKNLEPPLQNRWRAQALDCHLYAQDNQYILRKK